MAKIKLIVLLFLLALASPVWATDYYVSTTGSDSNDGSTDSPWRNPQKCVHSGTPLVAGDTCIFRSGTYTNESGLAAFGNLKGRIMSVSASSPVATSGARITLKSEVPNGAIFEIPNTWPGLDCNVSSCPFSGIYMSGGGSHYTIEGIRFTRPGSNHGANASIAGITMLTPLTGVIIRNNEFENIARNVCSDSVFGNAGVFAQESTSILIEKNLFRTIGRLRNGESGCTTVRFHHDHGVYLDVSTDATIQRNVFYDVTRGFSINLKARFAGTKTLRATVQHNTFSGDSPTTVPRGQISLVDLFDGLNIRNNIFNDPEDGYVVGWGVSSGTGNATTTGAGITFTNNLSNSTRAETSMTNPSQKPTSGITYSGNIMNTSPGFTSAGSNDFTLASGSAAINAGLDLGLAKCGSAPDIGAFEVCGPVSGSMNANIAEVTFDTAFPPVQTFGTTGWSLGCTGTGCGTPVVSGLTLKSGSSSVVSKTISGMTGGNCAGGQTLTSGFNQATGDLTDSIMIGGRLNQPIHTFSGFALTNNCGGAATTYPGSPFMELLFNDGSGTNANDSTANNRDGTLTNGPVWVAGKDGTAVELASAGNDYIATTGLSGINPSTTSYTFSVWIKVKSGEESGTYTYGGFPLGSSQRLHVGTYNGTWGIAIQTSPNAAASNLTNSPGWHNVCLQLDSTTDTATLYVDKIAGQVGTGAVKTYTSYVTAGDFWLGLPSGFTTTSPGAVYEDLVVYDSLVDCTTLYQVREPDSSGSGGTLTQVAHQWQIPSIRVGGLENYGGLSSSVNVPKGRLIAILLQTDRTVSAGSAFAPKLWASKNFGAAQPLTDTPGSFGLSFVGEGADASIYRGVADCCLSGALTPNNGTTQVSADALPTYGAGVSNSYIRRNVLKVAEDASGTFCVFERDQNGVEYNGGYSPVGGACLTVIDAAAGGQ